MQHQQLLDRIEELEVLLGIDRNFIECLRQSISCTPMEAKILGMLYRREFVSRESLYIGMHGDRPENKQPDSPKTLDTQVCLLRQVLRKYDIKISTAWGSGYYMTKENKAKLKELIERD